MNVESHKRYSAWVCVCVCMYECCVSFLCVCDRVYNIFCLFRVVALCTYMCIQFAGEQRVDVSETNETFMKRFSVLCSLSTQIFFSVECACFILGYNCFGSPGTLAAPAQRRRVIEIFLPLCSPPPSLLRFIPRLLEKISRQLTALSVGRRSLLLLLRSLIVIT